MKRVIFLPVMAVLMTAAMGASARIPSGQYGFLAPPTSPQSHWEPQLPQPPTPYGPVPNTTLRWPFGVLPYYYQSPVYGSSPYTRYLQSSPWARPFDAAPLPYIPSYVAPPYQEWPYYLPLY